MAEQMARGWGASRELILDADDSKALELEEWLGEMGEVVCGERQIYRSMATPLGWAFDGEQLRLISYLLWQALLTRWKRHRLSSAMQALVLKKSRDVDNAESLA